MPHGTRVYETQVPCDGKLEFYKLEFHVSNMVPLAFTVTLALALPLFDKPFFSHRKIELSLNLKLKSILS